MARCSVRALALALLFIAAAGANALCAECPQSFDKLRLADFQGVHLREPAHHIILMIGDGMSFAQVASAGVEIPKGFTAHGEVTHCSLSGVTDSAAAATALATGFKTTNLRVAMGPDGTVFKTILELAKDKGWQTGLVTTTEITHATPACFAAHQAGRENADEIAADYLTKSQPDLLLGGGAKFFVNRTIPDRYTVVRDLGQLRAFNGGTPKLLGIFAPSHLDWERSRPATEPSLTDLTHEALRFMERSGKPFFLMIEGGRIDHGAHANDLDNMNGETREFFKAITAALAWSKEHPRTQLLVTADHETGGLQHQAKPNEKLWRFTTQKHTATPVPIWGYGINAEAIRKTQDNRAVFFIMENALLGKP